MVTSTQVALRTKLSKVSAAQRRFAKLTQGSPLPHDIDAEALKFTEISVAYDGNPFSRTELTVILDGHTVASRTLQEHVRVLSTFAAFKQVASTNSASLLLTPKFFAELVKLTKMPAVLAPRSSSALVMASQLHVAALEPEVLRSKLTSLLRTYYRNCETDNFLFALAAFYAKLQEGQVFGTATGLISRLMLNHELLRRQYPLIQLAVKDRERHQDALEAATQSHFEKIYDFIITCVSRSLATAMSAAAGMVDSTTVPSSSVDEARCFLRTNRDPREEELALQLSEDSMHRPYRSFFEKYSFDVDGVWRIEQKKRQEQLIEIPMYLRQRTFHGHRRHLKDDKDSRNYYEVVYWSRKDCAFRQRWLPSQAFQLPYPKFMQFFDVPKASSSIAADAPKTLHAIYNDDKHLSTTEYQDEGLPVAEYYLDDSDEPFSRPAMPFIPKNLVQTTVEELRETFQTFKHASCFHTYEKNNFTFFNLEFVQECVKLGLGLEVAGKRMDETTEAAAEWLEVPLLLWAAVKSRKVSILKWLLEESQVPYDVHASNDWLFFETSRLPISYQSVPEEDPSRETLRVLLDHATKPLDTLFLEKKHWYNDPGIEFLKAQPKLLEFCLLELPVTARVRLADYLTEDGDSNPVIRQLSREEKCQSVPLLAAYIFGLDPSKIAAADLVAACEEVSLETRISNVHFVEKLKSFDFKPAEIRKALLSTVLQHAFRAGLLRTKADFNSLSQANTQKASRRL